jgi:hypothetical protein
VRALLAWVKEGSWDWAKAGAALYALGLLITSIYFLRFSILSIDLLRPQSIIVGLYFVLLYLLLPAVFLLLLTPLKWNTGVLVGFILLLVAKELALRLLVGTPPAAAVILILVLQLVAFVRLNLDRPKASEPLLRFEVVPKDVFAATAFVLLLVTFAATIYGSIPGYLGGGRPILVQVFTDTADLPSNRFMRTKNIPQINMAIPSFRLNLLYESEDYLYFVAEARGRMKGYSIMKLRRDEVLRMDYITPVWFSMGDDK